MKKQPNYTFTNLTSIEFWLYHTPPPVGPGCVFPSLSIYLHDHIIMRMAGGQPVRWHPSTIPANLHEEAEVFKREMGFLPQISHERWWTLIRQRR